MNCGEINKVADWLMDWLSLWLDVQKSEVVTCISVFVCA